MGTDHRKELSSWSHREEVTTNPDSDGSHGRTKVIQTSSCMVEHSYNTISWGYTIIQYLLEVEYMWKLNQRRHKISQRCLKTSYQLMQETVEVYLQYNCEYPPNLHSHECISFLGVVTKEVKLHYTHLHVHTDNRQSTLALPRHQLVWMPLLHNNYSATLMNYRS